MGMMSKDYHEGYQQGYKDTKEEYENRLRADLVAALEKLKKEIERQCKIPNNNASAYDWNNGVYACYKVIQQKINALRGGRR